MRATARRVESVVAAIEAQARRRSRPASTARALQRAMPAGAARNALDCALWDLEAKATRPSGAGELAGLHGAACRSSPPSRSASARPTRWARPPATRPRRPLLKLKLGGERRSRRASRRCAPPRPDAALIVDANEAWTTEHARADLRACAGGRRGADRAAAAGRRTTRCSPGSPHPGADLRRREPARPRRARPRSPDRYDAVNIKLDKTGGLTEALRARAEAAGARASASWSAAWSAPRWRWRRPCCCAQGADFVDLDGPLLLARDREPGLRYDGSLMHPPPPELWG